MNRRAPALVLYGPGQETGVVVECGSVAPGRQGRAGTRSRYWRRPRLPADVAGRRKRQRRRRPFFGRWPTALQRPHDKLFRAVFADHAEAAALLRAHLPEEIVRDLRWSTLTLQDRSLVDPDLLNTESDLLFSIRREAGAPPAWLYVLLGAPIPARSLDTIRLLKYCCRIWDRSRAQFPRERRLRSIVPVVFYQGPGRWRHATEFAELFADSVRDWPWVPCFAHLLVDQSREMITHRPRLLRHTGPPAA